ncbi:MAG: ATP-binding protein [Anaerolineaceae bacterium]|nr:ATP-binding protein [Anaerolineaceae bacterium]MBN2678389.1 ATP-binding protein [Anaerolineaceae bacterium]
MNASIRDKNKPIGYIIGGSLKESLRARLIVPPQEVREGSFVVIRTSDWQFYGLITDLQLGATDPRFADEPSGERLQSAISDLLQGQTLFTTLEVLPTLMLERGPDPGSPEYAQWREKRGAISSKTIPVKTIPSHYAEVLPANEGDVAEIFGSETSSGYFRIGNTREQGHPVCIDLVKLIQRSSGIFGATGTGKSFLTRIILSGLIKEKLASLLIFDMHNEYGLDDTATDTQESVPGLKGKFPAAVRIVGLGRGASVRGQAPDFNLEFAQSDIQPQDIELLTHELNLKDTTPATLDALVSSFGIENWYSKFKAMKPGSVIQGEDGKRMPAPDSVETWALENNVNSLAATSLHNKMTRLFHLPYIVEQPAANGLNEIIKALQNGQHIVLSFGDHENDLDYLLVTNLLTRRIREKWVEMTNAHRSHIERTAEPRQLVVVLEEAHKLLNHEMARQTTFSTIAREMRKYGVTLLVIDQRPSQIYSEVMSQLGSRICGWLGDDDDIHAVLSGLAGRDALRGMLARLQPKEEVILLGWGIPMPLVIQSRRYDNQFWGELLGKTHGKVNETQIMKELGFQS